MELEPMDSFTFIASTGEVDRAGDVVDQQGWELARYQQNPVVLLSHQWHLPPVGKALKTWVENSRLMARVQFAPTPLGRELALLHADGYMGAVSVGFRPLEWEIRRDARTGFPVGLHFHRQELLEISVVSLPANPEALRKALSGSRLQTTGSSPESEARSQEPDGLVWMTAPMSLPQADESVLALLRNLKSSLSLK